GTEPAESVEPSAYAAAGGAMPRGVSPATILPLAAWIGLIAGSFDLGLMAASRLIDGDLYRLGEHFVWMIPLGVAAMVSLPAAMLALLARLMRRTVPLGLAVALLSFVGFLDSCARLPLGLWASLLLSGGLAVQSARFVDRRRRGFLRLVGLTTPMLIGV